MASTMRSVVLGVVLMMCVVYVHGQCVELESDCGVGQPCECQNGGVCSNTVGSMACNCDTGTTGYAGFYCDVPQCTQAFGLCFEGECVAPGVCDCNPGWNGTTCNQPICTNPCVNGFCSGPDACNCDGTGFAGALCEIDSDECAAFYKACDPLSSCTNSIGNYTCTPCPSGFVGNPYLFYDNSPFDWNVTRGGCYPESATTTITTSEGTSPTSSSTDTSGATTDGTIPSGTQTSSSTDSAGLSSTSDGGGSSNVGVIIGASVAGVVVLGIIIALIIFFVFVKGGSAAVEKAPKNGGGEEMGEKKDWSEAESESD